jgi:hypothetical protein
MMTKVTLTDETNEVLTDYTEFCQEWEVRIKSIVMGSNLFSMNDIDDIVQDLLTTYYTKSYLEKYDPEKGASFATSVYNFVTIRIKGMYDNKQRLHKRETLLLDDDFILDNGDRIKIIDLVESPPENISIEFIDNITSIYRELEKIPVAEDKNYFPRLFSCIVQQLFFGVSEECVEALGEDIVSRSGWHGLNRKALAFEMGVSTTTISRMLARLVNLPFMRAMLER